jgi:hypothetical protein
MFRIRASYRAAAAGNERSKDAIEMEEIEARVAVLKQAATAAKRNKGRY